MLILLILQGETPVKDVPDVRRRSRRKEDFSNVSQLKKDNVHVHIKCYHTTQSS